MATIVLQELPGHVASVVVPDGRLLSTAPDPQLSFTIRRIGLLPPANTTAAHGFKIIAQRDDGSEQSVSRNAGASTADVPLVVDVLPGPNEFTVFFDNTSTAALPLELAPKLPIHRNRVPNPGNPVLRTTDRDPLTISLFPPTDVDGDRVDATITQLPAQGQLQQFDGTPITVAGTVVTDPSNRVNFVPTLDQASISFNYDLSDGFEVSRDITATIAITDLPPAPPGIPDLVASHDTGPSFVPNANTDDVTRGLGAIPDSMLVFEVGSLDPNGVTVQILRKTPTGPIVVGLGVDSDKNRQVLIEVPAGGSTETGEFSAVQIDTNGNPSDPTVAIPVAIDLKAPRLGKLELRPADRANTNSALPVPMTAAPNPIVELSLTEERFRDANNFVRMRLLAASGTELSQLAVIEIPGGTDGEFGLSPKAQFSVPLAMHGLSGQISLTVEATDAAGNISTASTTFFALATGDATYDAPGTPVFSNRYFLGSKLASRAQAGNTFIDVDRPIPSGHLFYIREQRYRAQGPPEDLPDSPLFRIQLTQTAEEGVLNRIALDLPIGEKVAWLRPWTPSFDKTTQTTWFTNEDGHRVGQFDPATATARLYDVSEFVDQATRGFDPHGVFFDFSTHLTPRVWFVYRNDHDDNNDRDYSIPIDDQRVPESGIARIAYLDLPSDPVKVPKLVSIELADLGLEDAHNIQVDDQGTVWMTAGHSQAIVELNFDVSVPGSEAARLDERTAEVIIHRLPAELGDRSASAFEFDAHGMQIVVDQRTGERYVYLSDANVRSGTGRVVLLRPGQPARHRAGVTVAATSDAWFEWNVDSALSAEGRGADGHALFIAVDDRETPGIPEDDRIVFSDTGRPNSPQGAVRVLEVGNVVALVQQNPLNTTSSQTFPSNFGSPLKTVRIAKLPGAAQSHAFASPIQAAVDREGNVVFADSAAGVGRFHPDDPLVAAVSDVTAPVRRFLGQPISETEQHVIMLDESPAVIDPPLQLIAEIVSPSTESGDRATGSGIDEYEVAHGTIRTGGRAEGVFRSTLNAGSIFYGSLSQSDNLTTTVFAETVRRQVEAVESKAALPAGATLGRLAFSVRRDGSLILTGREDGSVLDVQLNLSQLVSGMAPGAIPPRFLLEGEPNVVIGDDGTVTLFAVDQSPAHSLVRYRFQPSVPRTMKKADFADPARWSVTTFAPPTDNATGTLLVGEPTTFLDGQGNAGALATTEKGHLVLYRPQLGPGFVDLKEYLTGSVNVPAPGARPFVFSSVAIVSAGNKLFVYGTNMAGDLGEYVLENVDLPAGGDSVTNLSITRAKVLNETRPTSQLPRDTQVFQDVYAIGGGQTNHVFAGDGNARLVHFEIDRESGAVQAENVTELARDANQLFGYFPFQQEFGGRVYAEIAPLFVNGELFVYGTNGQDLIEFRRPVGGVWQAANLSNDLYSTSGTRRGGPGQPPAATTANGRFPANFVFGAPGAYVSPDGDRHILQINADGEIIEYYFDTAANPFARFHTQNITLRLAPSASADNYRTAPGRTLDVPVHEGLRVNDRDPSGLPLTVRVFQNPVNGTLELRPNGSFVYVPKADFVGQDKFTYEALNGINESKLITVTITVEQLPVGTILDDGNAGYGNTGSWKARTSALGVGGDFRESAKGNGKDVATWSLKGLPKNANREFEVFVHWVPQSNLATDAPFVIYDNKTVVGGKRINEQRAPFGDEAAGVIWQSLGKVKINSGTLKVTLGDNANGTVVADAVRIVPVTPTAAAPTTAAPPAASPLLLLVGPQPVDTWHNAAQPANVNNDSQVNSLDLLAVLNWLTTQGGPSTLPASGNPSSTGFIDVNNDGQCSTLDLLAVINAITAAQTSTGLEPNPEGESVTGIPRAAGAREVTSPDLIELLAIDSLTTRRKGARAR